MLKGQETVSSFVLNQYIIIPLQIDRETGKRTYNGYQLVRATPENEDHLDVLRFIEKGRKQNSICAMSTDDQGKCLIFTICYK